jgi:hypothetical protein
VVSEAATELGVKIDPDTVNRYLADRILESAIGEELQRQITKAVTELGQSYRSPFANIIAAHVEKEIARLIQEEYAEQITALVREKVTEQFTTDLIGKAFEAFERRAYA